MILEQGIMAIKVEGSACNTSLHTLGCFGALEGMTVVVKTLVGERNAWTPHIQGFNFIPSLSLDASSRHPVDLINEYNDPLSETSNRKVY